MYRLSQGKEKRMFSKWLNNSNAPEPDLPDKKTYLRYRNAGKDLNTKIMEALVDDAALRYGSRALKMGRGRQLILDSESDLDVLMEYIFIKVPSLLSLDCSVYSIKF